jgi:serine protease AprX
MSTSASPRAAAAETVACPLCAVATPPAELAEAGWAAPEVTGRVAERHPGWRRRDGACPACVQQALLELLLAKGEDALREGVQKAWPLDAEAAFGALPTPLRLLAHPRYTGAGVTVALVDAAFYPHSDLVEPDNRIRAWVDVSQEPVRVRRFSPREEPRWPGWDRRGSSQWHGLMTSAVTAGNGRRSHGLYRGLAPGAELVLVQVAGASGRIGNAVIARALDWLRWEGPGLGVKVVNLSLGGDPVSPLAGNAVDRALASLVEKGITVVAAAGNDGERRLVPPATAPEAVTVGGLDDKSTLDPAERALWHGNYGESGWGTQKPELVAPSLRVVAPLLPGTPEATEAADLFARRAAGEAEADPRIAELKLVTPYYQHVEGTSFAAPIVAGVVACMLEANPHLPPRRIHELLVSAARPVGGAPVERQGAGAIDAGRAVVLALQEASPGAHPGPWPRRTAAGLEFLLHDSRARRVSVVGSWDEWKRPGLRGRELAPGLWHARLPIVEGTRVAYKFLVDDVWLADPANPHRVHDGTGGWNSLLVQ